MIISREHIPTEEMLCYLPHRYPFLLVDCIKKVEINTEDFSNSHIIGIKAVSNGDSFLQGHFPGKPIMPGVLSMEGAMQTGCIALSLIFQALNADDNTSRMAMVTSIDKARFKKQIIPGDLVEYKIHNISLKRQFSFASAEITVDEKICCEFDFTIYTAKVK